MDPLAVRAVDALYGLSGRHEGHRALHAKAGWCEGELLGTPEGAALCRAPLFGGQRLRALVRFSNGSGDVTAHDGVRDGRGIAIKVFLPDGGDTDLALISVPVFLARTPEDFIAFVEAARRDPETGQPDMARLGAHLEAHPETAAALQSRFTVGPPRSWVGLAYNGIHAFRWIAPDGTQRWVRTRLVPDEPLGELADDEALALDPDYLRHDLPERMPAGFTLLARLAADGDPLDDPTAAWPEEREAVAVARLELQRAIPSPETPTDIHVFDPLRLCDGIEPSDDPILHFRRKAYDVSARRRWSS